jgi:arsenate reductase (thioredoxin)
LTTILFACTHNAGRSQMAAAFLNLLADPSKAHAISAGTRPADRVHPVVMQAMNEVGVDLSGVVPRLLTSELESGVDVLVTMGCGEECPFVAGAEVQDWPLPDPKDQDLERVREIRDEIRRRVTELAKAKGVAKT